MLKPIVLLMQSDSGANKSIVLFDGVCNLCNGFIDWLIKNDKNNSFKVGSLQSETAKKILAKHAQPSDQIDSVVLISEGQIYRESKAIFYIFKKIGFPYYIINLFSILPQAITDWAYQLIAKNRYRLFGRKESCRLPTEIEKSHFLSDEEPFI